MLKVKIMFYMLNKMKKMQFSSFDTILLTFALTNLYENRQKQPYMICRTKKCIIYIRDFLYTTL